MDVSRCPVERQFTTGCSSPWLPGGCIARHAGTFGPVAANSGPLRVLVVGQTPPPFGGQAVMIQELLDGRYARLRLFHVRMAFSRDMGQVGRFSAGKLIVLFATIVRIAWSRIGRRTPVLYYPPAGPDRIPVLRDIVLLCATRWMFRQVVFHFHAGGVSGSERRLPAVCRPFFRIAYRRPTLAIRTAEGNPDDGRILGARHDRVIPNGIADMRGSVPEHAAPPGGPLVVLFTGVLIESKGVGVLLEAFSQVLSRGIDARLEVMGNWGDEGFRRQCLGSVEARGMMDRVTFLGEKRDLEKYRHFAACDIFCFPSHFAAESFGLVLLEAMMFAKPVVSTRWRGIPSVVEDGTNGYLVNVRDAHAVADRLEKLARDPALRVRMGAEGRRIYEARFTVDRFRRNMEEAMIECLRPA